MAFAFGGLGGSSNTTISRIGVTVVNNDPGQFGTVLVGVLQSQDLADLLSTTVVASDAAARAEVDADRISAAVIIPANFPQSVLSSGASAQSTIEVYSNPTRQVTAGVVRSIVDQVLGRISAGAVSGQVAVTQLIANGLLSPQQAQTQAGPSAQRAGAQTGEARLITLNGQTAEKSNGADFDWLTYMTPSMAIMFLMFTVSNGGRSILAERDWGTLQRLLTTPTRAAHIIGGKVTGIYLTGLAQMAILIVAGGLMFGVKWGSGVGCASCF